MTRVLPASAALLSIAVRLSLSPSWVIKIIPRICFKPAYAYFRKVQEESKIPRIIFYEKNI